MPVSSAPDVYPVQAELVLSRAVVRAAQFLELPNATVARVLGISEATVSRLVHQQFKLQRGTKPFELAQLFVRLFRGLSAITGGDDRASRSWLVNENLALRARPIELIQSIEGLTRTLNYVDSRRARI